MHIAYQFHTLFLEISHFLRVNTYVSRKNSFFLLFCLVHIAKYPTFAKVNSNEPIKLHRFLSHIPILLLMNRHFTAFALAAAFFAFAGIGVQAQKKPNPAPPISINFDKDATKGQNRFLEYVKISSPNGRTIEKKDLPKDQAYFNYATRNQVVYVLPGVEVKFEYKWHGVWMDSYLYLDRNQNKSFDVTSMEDNELVYATVYNGQKKTKNGVEQTSDQWKSNFQDGTFTAPTKPGEYHLRFKIDWNSINPGGNTDENNKIVKNQGNIVDFVLHVYDTKELPDGYFTEIKYNLNVREFKNGNYATMMLPYPVRIPGGVHAYTMKGHPTTNEINFELVKSKNIPANTPVLITADKPGVYECVGAANDLDPIVSELYGTTDPLTGAERDEEHFNYFVLFQNSQGNAQFGIVNGLTIPANRCFLRIPKNVPVSSVHFELPQNVTLTAVNKVATDNNAETGATYNLAGQRTDATNAKGLVIRNGKKVWIP